MTTEVDRKNPVKAHTQHSHVESDWEARTALDLLFASSLIQEAAYDVAHLETQKPSTTSLVLIAADLERQAGMLLNLGRLSELPKCRLY